MKTSAWIRIVCWGFVLLILTGFLICGLMDLPFFGLRFGMWDGFSWWEDDKDYLGNGSDSYQVPASGIEKLKIDWVSGRVDLQIYDGEEICITETSNRQLNEKNSLRYKVSGDTLKIRFRKNGILFGNLPNKDLQVMLPKRLAQSLQEVQVDAVSAKIEVNDLQAEEMHYETTSGAIHLLGVGAKEIEVDTVSGNLDIEAAQAAEVDISTVSGATQLEGAFGTIHASGVSGQIKVQSSACPDRVSASTVSGGVTLIIPENEGFSVSFDRVSGEFSSDFPITLNEGEGTYKNGGADFIVDTVSGNFSVKTNP